MKIMCHFHFVFNINDILFNIRRSLNILGILSYVKPYLCLSLADVHKKKPHLVGEAKATNELFKISIIDEKKFKV